ncbi:hypothetical protein [Aquipuribacter sp. MA13-6]|uniref:hypothetical protein n=1 Tax=unclassified Aquipuribacter TaxID=2635084 RepID=UPI003EEBEB3E
MATWPRTVTRPGRGVARVALLLGLTTAVVVGLTLVARDPLDVLSEADLDRIEDAVEQGCPGTAEPLTEGTGYALDGTVVDVVAPPGRSPVRLTLRVQEWFLGPPLGTVEVWVDPDTVRYLVPDDGGPDVGARLLVSGRGWQDRTDALVAAGCGRTRAWDATTAADWRRTLGRPDAAAPTGPAGPVATYPSVDFVRAVPMPDLRGVAVLDGGCLYLQDGRTRWVPVLPAATTTWHDRPPSLSVGGVRTDVGHMVRFAGVPAGGPVSRGAGGSDPADVTARLVDPAGVPEACDPAAPRFVVAERLGPGALPSQQAGAAPVALASDALRRAGLRPTAAVGGVVTDSFGAASSRVELQTTGGEVLVHVESVAFLAWPHAYAPRDSDLVRGSDPDRGRALPTVPPGWELAVVTRSDGVTQVLLRTPGRVVVSVTADLTTLGLPTGGAVDPAVQALTDVATDVAGLSPSGGGS